MDDFSQRIVGLVLLLFLTLVAIAFLIVRRDDIRLSVVGRTPELRASSYQKTLGATVAVLVALIAVFGVMVTVESTTHNTNSQLAAQEEAHLNERFEAAAQMLGDTDSAAVRSAGITALAAIADDWMARSDRGQTDEETARLRRDQCIRTIEAYLKTPLPQDNPHAGETVVTEPREDGTTVHKVTGALMFDPADDEIVDSSTVRGDTVAHTAQWEEERAVRQVVYKVIGDHLHSVESECVPVEPPATQTADLTAEPSCTMTDFRRDPRTGHNWGDHAFDFSHSYLPDATFDSMIFWPADTVNFSSAEFDSGASFYRTWFGDSEFPARANFWHADFQGYANFRDADFQGDANFWVADFEGDADFSDADFQGYANFSGADFQGDADFGSSGTYSPAVRFRDDVSFSLARFGGGSCVNKGAPVPCSTNFSGRLFADDTAAEAGLRAAANHNPNEEEGQPGEEEGQPGRLAAGTTIDVGTDESGRRCRLVNDSDQDVPIPDLPLVCE